MNAAPREVRERLADAKALCTALALQMAPRATARQAIVLCPWHDERSPSCSVRVAKDGTISVRCHACGATSDALGLIAQVRGLDDFAETLRVAAELANAPGIVDAPKAVAPREAEPLSEETYDRIWTFVADACAPMRERAPRVAGYLTFRRIFGDAEAAGCFGLPLDARDLVASCLATFERKDLERAGVLREDQDAIDHAAWSLAIPWRDRYGRIRCVQRRRLDDGRPKYLSPRGRSPRAPFGVEFLAECLRYQGPEAEIIICEGALDALARRRISRARDERAAVIGVYSASSPDVGLPLDIIQGRRVVLSLDVDGAGEAACAKVAAALRGVASGFLRERVQSGKDWLDALNGAAGAS